MEDYSTYVDELDGLATDLTTGFDETKTAAATASVNSAMSELRRLVPLEDLRAAGSFFTPPLVAELFWSESLASLDEDSIVIDPTVGGGDLLLPALRYLAQSGQMRAVHERLRGFDIERTFVAAARARLRLATQLEGLEPAGAFDGIVQGNFLEAPASAMQAATHVVLNPPFSSMTGPTGSQWSGVSVNAAAIFVEAALEKMSPGSRLIALLPDVLRSGSRYARWRGRVASRLMNLSIRTLGQFDRETDIHVFVLQGKKAINRSEFPWPVSATASYFGTVADRFSVGVGSVVPHRDPHAGPLVKYASAQTLTGLSRVASIAATRRFSGRTHNGPLVLVRRTSRPGERRRARGVLVESSEAIAIENHLLVLKPLDGKLETCEELLLQLDSDATTVFLDAEIRCRHLTVGAVRSIPWVAPHAD